MLQVSFPGIYRKTTLSNNFRCLHCYGVTLVKKCNKPLLQINETKILDQRRFIKDLFKVNEKNNLGVLGINQIMSKFLTLSKRFQLNCQQFAAVVYIVISYFEHADHSHISHFTYHWRCYNITDHVLTSYIKLCYLYVHLKGTNQSC